MGSSPTREKSELQVNGYTNPLGLSPTCNITLTVKKPFPKSYPLPKDKSLGAYLKRKRLNLKWTRLACARFFEVSIDTYRNWEWNWFTPSLNQKEKVNKFLGFNYWDDKNNSLSNRCLMYRIEYGLTQTQLAELIEVNSKTVIRMENNKLKISHESIKKFEKLLNFNTEQIIENN
tara:strand:+ start:42 stop:566 length:525 start_codon:yes stop_codon:yes gene_type:complete